MAIVLGFMAPDAYTCRHARGDGAKRGSPPAALLRENFREDGKVKNRALANLSRWQDDKVVGRRAELRGEAPTARLADTFEISHSTPHGHGAAVLGRCAAWGSKR